MRPLYETPKDRANNKTVIEAFVSLFPHADKKAFVTKDGEHRGQKGCNFDGGMELTEKIALIAEVKNRTGDGERFPTWHVAKDKLVRCAADARKLNVPFFMLFSWDGKMYWWKVENIDKLEVRRGGRRDRHDPYDIEDMAHIPVSLFTRFK